MSSTCFERGILREATKAARKLGAKISEAWVHRTDRTWEFVYGDFHDCFQAENAYHARALGWEAWIGRQIRSGVVKPKKPVWHLAYRLSHESFGGHMHNDGTMTITVYADDRTQAIKRGNANMRRRGLPYETTLINCQCSV